MTVRNPRVCILLAFAGSALCSWPLLIEPNVGLPWWVPLLSIALCDSVAAALCPGGLWQVLAASATGAFLGLSMVSYIWPPGDPIARAWVPVGIAVATIASVVVALVAALAGRRVNLRQSIHRRIAWLLFLGRVAFGPVTLALTPPLVAHRMAVNDRLAAGRFASLKKAVQQTASLHTDLCDGFTLKRYYTGPQFSLEDWGRITGNYVQRDGYIFMVYCREHGGYTIDALPSRDRGEGTRHFCTDESGRVGCGMVFNGSRNACSPCGRSGT